MIDGKKLRGMRLDIGWSQNVMSKILEITRGSLAHYESGRAAVPDLVERKIKILHRGILHAIEVSMRI